VGCGTDTRAYRFRDLLCSKGVKVLECDQAEVISTRQRLTRCWGHFDYIEHLPIDLNDGRWPELEYWLGTRPKALVWMEGVSPYVNDSGVSQFLHLLATKLAAGSQVAYDFKIGGIKDDFGRDGRTQRPFRLSRASDIAAFHEAHGLRLERMELSSELCARLLPDLEGSATLLFNEDALVQLRVVR
jgi:O-methyltransferase involved in polyketide biosynthesis